VVNNTGHPEGLQYLFVVIWFKKIAIFDMQNCHVKFNFQ